MNERPVLLLSKRAPTLGLSNSCNRLKLSLLVFLVLTQFSAIETVASSVRGKVVDSESNQPLSKVSIYLCSEGSEKRFETTTGPDGTFTLSSIPPGPYEMVVSAVGFGLVKESINLEPEETVEFEIHLLAGTKISTELSVTADLRRTPAQLSSTEIEKLKGVLMDDPVRSLQHLPSLVSSDDFNSGFAAQGSGFNRVGILLDGIPVYSFFHTVEGLEDSGSTSILSSELLQDIGYESAGSSGEWTGSSAGFLSMQSRSGSNVRNRNLISVSGSAFLGVAEGPLGSGNWLLSFRKSYIDWIVRRIDPNSELNFGFYDVFGKFSQSAGKRNRVSVSFLHGQTGLHDVVEGSSLTSIDEASLTSSLFHLQWEFAASARLNASTHIFVQQGHVDNLTQDGWKVWEGRQDVQGIRTVWSLNPSDRLAFKAGLTAESWKASEFRYRYDRRQQSWKIGDFYGEALGRQQLFGEMTFSFLPSLEVFAGLGWNHQGAPESEYTAPYLGARLKTSSSTLSLNWGRSAQFPFFNQLFGGFGKEDLSPEKASTIEGFWQYRSDSGIELLLAMYRRTREEVPWRPEGLWRLVDNRITPPSLDPFVNLLEDRSTGAEVRVARRSSTGLSGWIGYACAKSQWSQSSLSWFPGNYDQRNSFSLFGHYRWTSKVELSAKLKLSSGLPLPVYAASEGEKYFVSGSRNMERLPLYSRVDVRLGKSFDRDRYRITLFVEVLNLLNRENLRFSGHDFDSVNPGTGQIYGLTQSQLPILPTAGLIVEF